MRKLSALTVLVLLVATVAVGYANPGPKAAATMFPQDTPARVPHGILTTAIPTDTFNFGYYTIIGGTYYAINFGTDRLTPGNSWTFDHGAPVAAEGWTSVDLTDNPSTFFQRITAATWSGHGNTVAAPIIQGTATAWVGVFEDQADALCWSSGLGYGNQWCQRLTSPSFTYTGSGTVGLSFQYFQDSEVNFDYGKIEIQKADQSFGDPLNSPGFSGKIGNPATSNYPTYNINITGTQVGSSGGSSVPFKLVFEFTSDGGWSDEDGHYQTAYGPFATDNVNVNGSVSVPAVYDFESGLQGWTATGCLGKGSFFHIADVNNYTIQDPCACRLSGNVAVWHHPLNYNHPDGQHEQSESPPADIGVLGAGYNRIVGAYDVYAEMPYANGVLDRIGFDYYPFLCPATGSNMWSGRVGDSYFHFHGDTPVCSHVNYDDVSSSYVGSGAQLVKLVYEVYASCDGFGIPSTVCSGVTNATPLMDNLQLRVTGIANAPLVAPTPGSFYTDGFAQGLLLSSTGLGNSDCVYDLHRDDPIPDYLGDSLEVEGPVPTTSTKYECRLWFRLKRIGPQQNGVSAYNAWKTRVTSGGKPTNIVGATAAFTWGWMDSVQVGTGAYRNRFDSYFRENDPSFNPGAAPDGDRAKQNGILLDQIFVPGTKVEYFVTANYICTPSICSYLPDTTGKYYANYQILPSYRVDASQEKFPCVLFVDGAGGTNGQPSVFLVLRQEGPGRVLERCQPSEPGPDELGLLQLPGRQLERQRPARARRRRQRGRVPDPALGLQGHPDQHRSVLERHDGMA